jgi:integrase
MSVTLRRMEAGTVTVHGFRSSFRDWAGNETSYPRDLIETTLAHAIGDKAEQAYRRSDALEKRRKLMEAWASYCELKVKSQFKCITFAKGLKFWARLFRAIEPR